jgi:hypothetical protein
MGAPDRTFSIWEVFMPFIFYVWKNRWLRYPLLLLIGGFIYLAGMGAGDEAAKYKDGPQTVDIESLSEANLEYDYVKLTGFADSAYYYTYYTEGKEKEQADEDKDIELYYALHTVADLDVAISGGQSQPAVLVKQFLPKEERACIDTAEGCDISGELTLEGRLSKEPPLIADKGYFEELAKDLYIIDGNTLYLDAHWKPSTASSASVLGSVGLGWIGATIAGLAYGIFRRRNKKNVLDEAAAKDPNLMSSQEQQ